MVLPLREAMEREFNAPVKAIRVSNLSVPDGSFIFPLKGRYEALREGQYSRHALEPVLDEDDDDEPFDGPPDAPDPKPGKSKKLRSKAKSSAIEDKPEDCEDELERLLDECGLGPDEGEVEVLDANTGKMEFIPKDDPSYYDSSGYKGRRYKGSKKPDSIPTHVWRAASRAQREKAKSKAELEEALEKHKSAVASFNSAKAAISTRLSHANSAINKEAEAIPAMPVFPNSSSKHEGTRVHRDKLAEHHEYAYDFIMNALVARPVGQKEINNNPAAQAALDKEWNNLVTKGAWDYKTVREWKDVSDEAIKSKTKVHVGKVFEICVEKGSELPEGNPLRKFKGRTVFQGNNVKDESSDVALFAELGSSPANMEAGKSLDACGSMPGNRISQGDGKQAYTQALMKGIRTWIRLPRNRWPKEWVGKYHDPVVPLVFALYGHPDSGGLWQLHCEKALMAVGFQPLYPECWPSMFWHPKLKLLLGVYVDDFKMSGPSENIDEGWKLISSKIDMDTPEPAGRYLGCEHIVHENIKLDKSYHPFAHVFDASVKDPAEKPAAPVSRTQDYWEHDVENGVMILHHVQPRKKFQPLPKDSPSFRAGTQRLTVCKPFQQGMKEREYEHDVGSQSPTGLSFWWTGASYFVHDTVPSPQHALASAKIVRDKSKAKKAARAQGFTFLDELETNKGKCMEKSVNAIQYDMKQFLQQCLDRYVELAGPNITFKKVATPFHDDKIARPVGTESEKRGELQPIASRILMKVLFAARMARYDLLRATQGLASRVTKWSSECDKGLHRLMCYIHSTLDKTMVGFVGDAPDQCKVWLFADSDHAGEHDSRSTSGCVLALVGPNTYYPLTAFSKKQTSTAMSSTEAEVTAANLAMRAVGLPSSCLWSVIRNAGGDDQHNANSTLHRGVETSAKNKSKEDYWEHHPYTNMVTRVHVKPRKVLFNPIDSDCPINLTNLARQRYTIMQHDGKVDFDLTWDWTTPLSDLFQDFEWTGKTVFRIPGPNEVDYGIESREIKSALTDDQYIGNERIGDESIYMVGPGSLEVVFLEDNQATIRILETGRSPAFRHTDKTQRLNLGWLSEQFRRKHFRLVYVNSILQAADVLTKPFTSAEKWNFCLKLMSIIDSSALQKPKARKACAGEPACPSKPSGSHDRILVEFCCGPNSKLGDTTRRAADGCYVVRCTEDRDVTNRLNRISIRDEILTAVKTSSSKRIDILLWISIPCTGGTTWSYVNLQHESARLKVEYHRLVFDKIWAAMVDFVNIIRHLSPIIAIEWPSNCVYWKFERVMKFCQKHQLKEVTFDGCMIGIKDHNDIAIKKPWKILTTCDDIIRMFSELKCDNQHEHVQGRGEDLKNTEQYSYDMTDRIHSAFVSACGSTSSHPTIVLAAVRSSSLVLDMSYRVFPEGDVKEADYSAAAEAAGLVEFNDQGEPIERPRKIVEGLTNGDQWKELLEEIFHTTSTCRVVNESTEVEHLSALVDQSDPSIAQGNLAAISPHDASLLEGTNTFSVRAMACPGEPEANFLFTGDSFMSLVDLEGGKPVSRRNVGEYIQEYAKDLLPGKTNHVRHEMRWGKGLPQILDAIDHGLLQLRQKGTSRPCIIVVAYAGNDIYGANGFVDCDWIDQGSAAYSKKRRDAARVDLHFECLNKLVALTKRPEVGNIVMIMPWFGRGFNLHPNYDAQMIREANVLRQKGICTLDGTSLVKATSLHAENSDHNRLQFIRFFSSAARLGYSLFRLRSCEPLMKHSERRRELLAEQERQRSAAEPEWEEMEEVLEELYVDGYLMYVKEMRPKRQRAEQVKIELKTEAAQEGNLAASSTAQSSDSIPEGSAVTKNKMPVPADLPGEPEYFLDEELGPIEVEVSDKEIEKILAPHLDDALSDTNDLEEDDEEIVFNAPNVGGSASALKKVHKTVSIHAVDFHLDGSGIINVLGTDATRDKGKLELVKETMISAASATTIRRFELSAEAADQQKPAVKEEVDYEGDDEGTPGVGELAVKPPPKKVAKTEAKMPTPRGTVAGFLAKEVASEVLKYTEVLRQLSKEPTQRTPGESSCLRQPSLSRAH